MNPRIASLWLALTLTSASCLAADECSFQPPQPLLQKSAVTHYKFVRTGSNSAVETATLDGQVRIEVRHEQCVDFVTHTLTLIAPRAATATIAPEDWLDFAAAQLAHLKLAANTADLDEMKAFLKQARGIKAQEGSIAICRDGSSSSDMCSWDSLGGYRFEVHPSGNSVRIVITEYQSG